ncbi:putative non-LTR retroelement reverse transcriptase, partial [Tanacetum coccineum]
MHGHTDKKLTQAQLAQGRTDKKLTQAQLAQMINEKPQIIQETISTTEEVFLAAEFPTVHVVEPSPIIITPSSITAPMPDLLDLGLSGEDNSVIVPIDQPASPIGLDTLTTERVSNNCEIHVLVNKIWPLGDKKVKIDVVIVDKTTVKFRIKDEAVRNRVLRRGMWNICGIPMIISKWSPIEEDAQPEVKKMPVWVVVKNLPRYMYAWEGFAFMTSPIGEPIRLHPETEMCKNFEEGRVFVEADLTKPLPTQYNFDTEEGENVLVTFEYPWLPPRCHQCSNWGHNIDDCLKKKEVASGSPTKSPKKVGDASNITVEKSSQVEKPVLDEVEQGNIVSPVQVNSGSKEKEETIDPKKVVDVDQEEGWSTPPHSMNSPRKVTKDSKYGDVRIEASCFSALNGKGENGEDMDAENMEEGEVSNNDEEGIVLCDPKKKAKPTLIPSVSCETRLRQSTRIGSRDSRGGFNGGKLNPKDNTNGESKQTVVKNWVQSCDFDFGCLIETKIKEKKEAMIVSRVFHGWSSMSNYEHHRLGRLWVVWKQNVRVTPLFKSSQVISCSIFVEGRTEEMLITFVYALNTPEERKALWEDLKTHKDSGMFRGKPWLICGDFNEILDMEEHSLHDSTATIPEGMSDFQDLVNYCELVDLSYQGPKYTWCNKRKDDLICKKLDRVLANQEWLNHYTQSYCVFESGGCSDHNRCRLYMKEEAVRVKRPFKFSNVLVSHAGYMNTIKEKWATMEPLYHSTSALFRFSKKLKHLKPSLRSMGRELLSDLERKTKEAYIKLCTIQEVTMSNPSSQVVEEEALAYNIWSRLADIEERYFKQKAKLRWVNHGDQNTKAFHTAVKLREVRNNIREIICFDGSVVSSVEGIKREAERHFRDFMNERPTDFVEWSVSELKEVLDFQCTEEDKQLLAKEVNEEEIRKVVFAMPREKSPGPDGFTIEFFKDTWDVVGKDLLIAVQSFFQLGFLPKGINSTILALIPKKKGAKTMKDYRPISCCN